MIRTAGEVAGDNKDPLVVLIAGVAERLCTRLQTELEGFDSPLPLSNYSKKPK